MYADIIVNITHSNVDRPFRYRIPDYLEDDVMIGCQVVVPFGTANKEITGYCIGISTEANFDVSKIKDIISLRQKGTTIESKQILLADFLKRRYGVTMVQALKTVLPVKLSVKDVVKKVVLRGKEYAELLAYYETIKDKGNQKAKARLIEALLENDALPYEQVTGSLAIGNNTLKLLEESGYIRIEAAKEYRNPVHLQDTNEEKLILSPEQQHIIEEVSAPGKYYIHGITGSGKTAVYIELIEKTLKEGKQAIVLIPEISLTYQTLKRFYARFGDKVSVINSTLSAGEKYDQIERAKKGDIQVIIGPRSALFTPFPNLGLIIMDEEHDTSYKSEISPKYHAREVAEEVTNIYGAGLVLGSATPSIEAYYQVKQGNYQLFKLEKRLTGGALPSVEVVDLREELRAGNRSIFSRSLQDKIAERLEKKEQMMLFLNRRGYSGFISCRSCGHVIQCPHCSVSLSQHKDGYLRCHYCGYTIPSVKTCPECHSKYIAGFKVGTQQIEEKLKELFPTARVLRMDADTTKTKDSYATILSDFLKGEADILVGTQMIVKGHDFPRVTLVGVLAADLSLAFQDFRSGERTFQLLAQAAGREGRGTLPGEVVIQTYQPDHYSVQFAKKHDYEGFYEQEMLYRELMQYPPAGRMMAIQLFGTNEAKLKAIADDFADYLKMLTKERKNIRVLGASKAAVAKLKDMYRYVIYVKANRLEPLFILKSKLDERKKTRYTGTEIVQYDFDPVNLF